MSSQQRHEFNILTVFQWGGMCLVGTWCGGAAGLEQVSGGLAQPGVQAEQQQRVGEGVGEGNVQRDLHTSGTKKFKKI